MPVFTSIGLALGATIAASAGAGMGAFGVGVAVASLAAAGIATAVGTSMYSAETEASQQKKLIGAQEEQQNKAIAFQEKQVADAEVKIAGAEKLATAQAATTLKKKRAAMTSSILTSPLGITTEANTGMAKLLGG